MRLEKWTRRISRGFMQFYGFMYHGTMVESSKLMHCFFIIFVVSKNHPVIWRKIWSLHLVRGTRCDNGGTECN